MKKRISILVALAVVSCSVVTPESVHAQSNEPPSSVNPFKKDLVVIEQTSEIVKKTEKQLSKEAEEAKKFEAKKLSLSEELEKMKREIEEMKQKIADKKALEAATARANAMITPVVQTSVSVGSSPVARVSSRSGSGGPNAYAWGYCTWHVKNQRPDIGSYWGNANQWYASAQAAGYSTGSAPAPGAIGVSFGGVYGHVVYVESVNGGMVNISEMAYNGGIGVVHYRTVPASSFVYIY